MTQPWGHSTVFVAQLVYSLGGRLPCAPGVLSLWGAAGPALRVGGPVSLSGPAPCPAPESAWAPFPRSGSAGAPAEGGPELGSRLPARFSAHEGGSRGSSQDKFNQEI